jgi:hypothetical protein
VPIGPGSMAAPRAALRLGHAVTIPSQAPLKPSPEAVGPTSRLWRRYADAPAAALLTGLGMAAGLRALRKESYA